MTRSVCFVLMPFGRKPDSRGRTIDFDAIYQEIIQPGVADSGLLAVRADEEQAHGFIHKLMYERLLLSEYAVADLTILNANVFYELGVRHAARPSTTVMTMAADAQLPFDVQGLRALPYALNPDGSMANPAGDRKALADRLKSLINHDLTDSPLYQLLEGLKPLPIDRERTDVFRDRANIAAEWKDRLAAARDGKTPDAVAAVEAALGDPATIESGVMIDLLLSYRAVSAHERMIDLVAKMDRTLAATLLVREQLAFALNRVGRDKEAEEVLANAIRQRGPSSETNGLLGRVYKDRYRKAKKAGDAPLARAQLKRAIETYLAGYHADIRDVYPGINALTLMEIAGDERRHALLPVVDYVLRRRLAASAAADYWDHATRLELAALGDRSDDAEDALGDALACPHEPWQRKTTADNLGDFLDARRARGQSDGVLPALIARLGA